MNIHAVYFIIHDVHDAPVNNCVRQRKEIYKKKKRKEKQIHTKKETKLRIQKNFIKNQTKQFL